MTPARPPKRPSEEPSDEDEIDNIVYLAKKTRELSSEKPSASLNGIRRTAEAICRHIFRKEVNRPSHTFTLEDFLTKFGHQRLVSRKILPVVEIIQKYDNFGSDGVDLTDGDEQNIRAPLEALDQLVEWFFKEYLSLPIPENLGKSPAAEPTTLPPPRILRPTPHAVRAKRVPVKMTTHTVPARGRPHRCVVDAYSAYLGTDVGEWIVVEPAGVRVLAPLPGSSCAVLHDGGLAVGLFEGAIARLIDHEWEYLAQDSAVLALAISSRGLIAGHSSGVVTLVRETARPLAEVDGPVTDLLTVGDRLAILSGGRLGVLAMGENPHGRVVSVDTSSLGHPVGLFPVSERVCGVVGPVLAGLLDTKTMAIAPTSDVFDDGLRRIVPLSSPAPYFAVLTDGGQVWILDEPRRDPRGHDRHADALVRMFRERRHLPRDANDAIGLAGLRDGAFAVWTADGSGFTVTGPRGTVRELKPGIAFACPAPKQSGGMLAVRWQEGTGVEIVWEKSPGSPS